MFSTMPRSSTPRSRSSPHSPRRFEDRFEVMPAGTIVTTGSMTVPFAPKHRIIADYGPLGVNELIFSDI